VTGRVLSSYRQSASAPTAAGTHHDVLTARELEVLCAMAAGQSNAEIASTLFISELTVKSHIGRIFTKLELRDRPAAIVYAYDHGLVSPGSA
jgi:DNA-binding NarL/FixJ family response regulator